MGYALTTKWAGYSPDKLQLIGFDMGGTSTDVSRFAGSYEHVFESSLAGAYPTSSSRLLASPLTACDVIASVLHHCMQ